MVRVVAVFVGVARCAATRACVCPAPARCAETRTCTARFRALLTARSPCAAASMADRGCALAGYSEQSCRPDVALSPGLRPATGWAECRRRAGREPVEIQPNCALPAAGGGARLQQDPSPALHLPSWQVRCAESRSRSAGQMGMLWSKATKCSSSRSAPTPDSCCLPLSVPPDLACPCPPFLASSPTSVPCYARLVRPAISVLHRTCHAEEPARRGASPAGSWS
jgi:hypothetical protein